MRSQFSTSCLLKQMTFPSLLHTLHFLDPVLFLLVPLRPPYPDHAVTLPLVFIHFSVLRFLRIIDSFLSVTTLVLSIPFHHLYYEISLAASDSCWVVFGWSLVY